MPLTAPWTRRPENSAATNVLCPGTGTSLFVSPGTGRLLFFAAPTPRTRKVALRSAITFSPVPGNAFAVLLNLVRFGLGVRRAPGASMCHGCMQLDCARAVEFLMARDDFWPRECGLAPTPPIANLWPFCDPAHRPTAFPLRHRPSNGPRFSTHGVGTGAQSRWVVPGRLLEAGFQFQFPEWPEAAQDLVHGWRHRFD